MKKLLTIGIVVLFVVINVTPLTGSLSIEKPSADCSMVGSPGISLITIKVIGEVRNGWYVSNVLFNITNESDDIASIFYGLKGEWTEYTGPFNVSEDGWNIPLEWYTVNYTGNKSNVDYFIFDIDQTKPYIEVRWDAYQKDGKWYVKFTVNAADAMSGMDRVEMYINEGYYETVVGPGPLYEFDIEWFDYFNSCDFKFVAFDKVGHSDYKIIPGQPGSLGSPIFSKGIIKEQTSHQCSQRIVSTKDIVESEKIQSRGFISDEFNPSYIIVVFNRKIGNNDWIVNDVNLSIISDPEGIESVYYKLDDGEWTLYNDFLVVSKDGDHKFSWYIIDLDGYSSTPDSIFFKIDQTPPDTVKIIKPRNGVYLFNHKILFRLFRCLIIGYIDVIVDAFDNVSGVEKVQLFLDSQLIGTYRVPPYEWFWDGPVWIFIGEIRVNAYDYAGNKASDWIDITRFI